MLGAALSAVVLLGVVNSARAEEPSAPAAAPKGSDIVRLKNGGLLRGTIVELLPGESVTITTATGKTREVAMAEVDYAGPGEKDPAASHESAAYVPPESETTKETSRGASSPVKPYVTVTGQTAYLHLVSEPEGLTFHRKSGTATSGYIQAIGFDRLCVAPCDIEIPAGTEELSLSKPNGAPVKPSAVELPAGNSEIVGRYNSKVGVRVAGIVVLSVGVAVGMGLVLASMPDASDLNSEIDTGMLGVGFGLMAAGGLAGGIMIAQRDSTSFEITRQARALSWPATRQISFGGRL